MKAIESKEWVIDGTLTVWEPSEQMAAAPSHAPTDPTPPSFLQKDHIRGVLAHRAHGDTHRAYTCAVANIPGPLDADAMTTAINDFVRSHEGLRSTFAVTAGQADAAGQLAGEFGGASVERTTVPASAIDLIPRVLARRDELDSLGGNANDLLNDYLPTHAIFDHFPGFVIGTVDKGQTCEVFYAVDHAFGDGLSLCVGILEIMARYTGTPVPGLVEDTHPSFVEYTREEYQRAAAVTPDSPGATLMREFIEVNGGAPHFPLPIGIENNEPQPVKETQAGYTLADAHDVKTLRAVAHDHGVSFSTVVFALLALAEHKAAHTDRYSTIVVSSTRGKKYATSQGWFCNFNPLTFDIKGDTLHEVLPAVAEAQQKMRDILYEPVHASIMPLLSTGVVDASIFDSPQLVTYMDLSWFAEPEGANIRLLTGTGNTKNASLWVFRNPDGLVVGSQAPDNPTAAESFRTFFRAFRDAVHDAVQAAEQSKET
ncbi:acyltransferase [Corynebacterium kroppenstedtii]|uniref:acyltransferase n=1 Tax=Corynebacterium sp. PCR 32 TaxID=3351342 RepID=UPI0030B02DF5